MEEAPVSFDMSVGTASDRSKQGVNESKEAVEVLLIIRRRLLQRMASVIVRNRNALLNGQSETNNPLAYHKDVAEIIKTLAELDGAIEGLAPLAKEDLRKMEAMVAAAEDASAASKQELRPMPPGAAAQPAPAQPAAPAAPRKDVPDIFRRFADLVGQERLEEASRELSRILGMSLDPMVTATRFFSRATKANASTPYRLLQICKQLHELSDAQCIKALIQTFGFQAVEARAAMIALKTRIPAPTQVSAN